MKIKHKTNYVGYFPILRGIQLLLKNGVLSFAELGAYICFASQVDFDNRHETYGAIIRDDCELAKGWSCDSSNVYRKRKGLIKKGLLYEKNGFTYVTNFYLFELKEAKYYAKLPIDVLQTFFEESQNNLVKEQNINAKLQKDSLQKDIQSSKISSKGNSSLNESISPDEIPF